MIHILIQDANVYYTRNRYIFYSTVGGETLENIDQSSKKRKNQLKFNDNSKWHKVSVIKSGYETTLVVDRTRSSTHKGDITFNGENGRNGKTWKKRKSNVPENIGVDKVKLYALEKLLLQKLLYNHISY